MILDATAGNRAIWFEKNHENAIFIDVRKDMKPDILADCRYLPFKDKCFEMVVFDPPHANLSPKSQMAKTYGSWSTWYIRDMVRRGGLEFDRVLDENGKVLFKWNSHDISLREILKTLSLQFKPLFGHKVASKTKHSSSTYWCCLKRRKKPLITLQNFVPITIGGKESQ